MGALNFMTEPKDELVKIAWPVSAWNAWSRLPPLWAPTAQTIDSAPPPVVLEMGEKFPLTPAHQAVTMPGGAPAVMRKATRPLTPPGQDAPFAGNARIVPVGVPITVGAVTTTPLATWAGGTTPPPMPPRLSRSARCSFPSFPKVAT